jgi:uncharacterized membrane protein
VGIASHPLDEIPGLLRNDGSPPLYYLLLALTGASGEVATRALSVVFALLTIPAALWAGRALFGNRAGWAAAAVAATAPLLTEYAQETRMYALLALLSVLACGTYALGFLHGRRRMVVAFAVLAVLMLYTHNWAIYLLAGLAAALPIVLRRIPRDAVIAAAAIAVAYAPWIPSLLYQAEHTGAPWSHTPNIHRVANALLVPLGASVGAFLAIAVAAYGLRRVDRDRRGTAIALGIALLVGGVLAWVVAQVEPGWADRYQTAFMGPVVLLVGAGLAAAGRAGLAALAVVLVLFALQPARDTKSNVRAAADAHPELRRLTAIPPQDELRHATDVQAVVYDVCCRAP